MQFHTKKRLFPFLDFSQFFIQRDWKRYIIEKLQGEPTFPRDFETAAEEELKTEGLRIGMHIEIMDTQCVRRTRIATIEKLTGGGRISVKYFVSHEKLLFYNFQNYFKKSKH